MSSLIHYRDCPGQKILLLLRCGREPGLPLLQGHVDVQHAIDLCDLALLRRRPQVRSEFPDGPAKLQGAF